MKQTLKKAKRLLKPVYSTLKLRLNMYFRRDLLLSKTMWGGVDSLAEEIAVNCRKFLSEEELNNKTTLRKIENDLIKCYFKGGFTPIEYFGFGFRSLNPIQRSEFISTQYKDRIMIKKVGLGDAYYLLKDKFLFYEKFKDFFNRDACVIKTASNKESFLLFVRKHPKFIAKRIKGAGGIGAELIDTEKNKQVAEEHFYRLLSLGEYICEELVVQHEALAAFNLSSINTIRIFSFMNKEGFHIFKPCLRIGRAGSCTDNMSSGGMAVLIDEKTGLIISDAVDKSYSFIYESHPDSGVKFKGYQIPYWDDLLQKVEQVHRTIEYYPYVGWDFALSEKGWVLIEGNWGALLCQYIDKVGVKKKFESMFD